MLLLLKWRRAGESPYIFDFEYIAPDERTIIPKLFERKEKFDDPACTLGYPEMYIETEMTFVSGDRLIIACESIVMWKSDNFS